MKQFFQRHRKSIFLQSFYSCSVLSLFVYIFMRSVFYEFPMSWAEESLFFIKMIGISQALFVTAVAGSAWLYKGVVKMKREA